MLQEFVNQEYLIIESNLVTNVVIWDGDTNIWTPPAGSIALIKSTTPAMIWVLDTSAKPSTWKLTEVIGAGEIGFTWDGSACITNQPEPVPSKPAENQPLSNGTQTA